MRKRTKRKHYALVNPVTHVLEGVCPTPQHLLDKLRLNELAALDAITKGAGGVHDWRILVDMMNICETMARSGIGPEALPVVEQMQEEMLAAAKRFEATSKMGVTGTGLQVIREVFSYHDAQRAAITRGEYEQMIQRTKNLIRGKAKNVKVIV